MATAEKPPSLQSAGKPTYEGISNERWRLQIYLGSDVPPIVDISGFYSAEQAIRKATVYVTNPTLAIPLPKDARYFLITLHREA